MPGRRLDYAWRLLATGLSFLLFGVGGLILALIVFPAINLFYARDPERQERIAQKTVRFTWYYYLRFMELAGVIDFEVRNAERLRSDRGTIIIANHPSLLDIVLLMSLLDRAQCVVKEGVWRNPVMAGVVRAANYIPNVNDPEALLDKCERALDNGSNLIIFPEGSRSVPGRPRRYQRGFAHLATRTGAALRLVTITCDPPTLLKGQRWYEIPPRRPRFVVSVKETIDPAQLELDEEPSIAVRQLARYVADRYEELIGDGTTRSGTEAAHC